MIKSKTKKKETFHQKNLRETAAAEGKLALGPAKQVLKGLDGQQLRATTPPAVQEAANEYFDRKANVEQVKDRMAGALDKIESEMKASRIEVCVVCSIGGELMTCRIRNSSKLEIKKQK